MSYEKQNFEDGQVLEAEHLNKMEDELARPKNWKEIEGKPFVTVGGDTLEWDGNTEGRATDNEGFSVKISDAIPTYEDVSNGVSVSFDGGIDGNFAFEDFGVGILVGGPAIMFIVSEAGVGVDFDGLIFPETGFYFQNGGSNNVVITIPGYTGFTKEQIDPKVLPDTVRLYFGADEYLYKMTNVADASTRITKNELRSLVLSNKNFVLYLYAVFPDGRTIEDFLFPATVDFDSANPYGSVGVVTKDGLKNYYTAEYTPPTT